MPGGRHDGSPKNGAWFIVGLSNPHDLGPSMTDAFDREVFDGQELVFQWGDPGDSAYVIEEGCVEVLTGVGPEQRRIAI